MPSPKGKRPYADSGGEFGYLGRGENYYTDTDLKALGEGLIKWIKQDGNIWVKYYFLLLDYPITWGMVDKLAKRSPQFASYLDMAKAIQESKLVQEPYDQRKRRDSNHARFILSRHHKQEWEDKPQIIEPEQIAKLDKAAQLVDYLQSESARKIAESNINNADKSKLETDD